jgi:hypothetical protein
MSTTPATSSSNRLRYCVQPIQRPREFDRGVSANRAFSIIRFGKKWVNGTDLTYYCYRNGDAVPPSWCGGAADIEAVQTAFQKWFSLGIGISFRPTQRPDDAMARIGFDPGDGSWSYVGRDVLNVRDPAERTMNFGWSLSTPYGRDTALHEIGHTLGLEHEHQNPFAGIVWDEEAVRAYFREPPNNWNDAQINHNIIDKIAVNAVKGTAWDPDSVMEYEFEPGLVKLPAQYFQTGLKPGGGLSGFDQSWVRVSYPAADAVLPKLEVALSQKLALAKGETRSFAFVPDLTRTYSIGTFGTSDTVLVLFEVIPQGNVQIAGDDDSGEDRNALITMRLTAGRSYQVGVRLYHADSPDQTSVMVW